VIGVRGRPGDLAEETAPPALIRCKPLVAAALREAALRLSPQIRRVVAYHLGWLDESGREVESNGGKAIRPALTLLCAEAVGAAPESALTGAVALELVHNFSLIHDDVMDGDALRRHRPTVWALFGVGQAITAGDALAALANRLLQEDPRPEARAAAIELGRATAQMIQGQSEDLAFESRLDVTERECLAMSAHKTGALLGCAGAVGAIFGGGDAAAVRSFRSFGRHLGLAFQAVDDVLGIWGDPQTTGKPVASDVRQHKKSIPVVHALRTGGSAGRELGALLSGGELSGDRLSKAVALLEATGSRAFAEGLAARRLGLALAELDGGRFDPEPAQELRRVARFVLRRAF